MKGLLKKWPLTGNSLKNSNQKNQRIQSSYGEQNKKNQKSLKAKTEPDPCSQEEKNWSKFEKSIQKKTVRTLQDQN